MKNKSTRSLLDKVFRELEFSKKSQVGFPRLDNNYLVFKNKVVNLASRKVYDFSPDIFTTHRLIYEYDPSAEPCPVLNYIL